MDPKRLTYILAALFIPCAILVGIFRCGMAPRLHPGDKIESRTCRQCDLRKVRKECAICGGDGKVDVIVPGPNRPTTVIFDVFDKNVRYPETDGREFAWVTIPGQAGFAVIKPGALEDATIVITGPGGLKVERKTFSTGQWTESLKPGPYSISVNRSGYKPFIRKFDIPVIAGWTWLEDVYLDENDLKEYYAKHPKEAVAGAESRLEIGLIR